MIVLWVLSRFSSVFQYSTIMYSITVQKSTIKGNTLKYITTETIITKSVLNNKTGEIKDEEFIQRKAKREVCKGGWRMMYNDFEYVLISMKSPKEVKALLQLKNMFKASTSQIVINKSTMCKNFGMTRVPFSNFITRLISYNFLIELSDKQYRMNPFMYLPYQSQAKELQDEWERIRNEGLYKRRGISNKEYKFIRDKKLKIGDLVNVVVDKNRVLN